MSKPESIQVGDLIKIEFPDGTERMVYLMRKPQGHSDTWLFQREDNGQLYALNSYSLNSSRWKPVKRGPFPGDREYGIERWLNG